MHTYTHTHSPAYRYWRIAGQMVRSQCRWTPLTYNQHTHMHAYIHTHMHTYIQVLEGCRPHGEIAVQMDALHLQQLCELEEATGVSLKTQNECDRLESILANAGEIHKCVCNCVCMQASVQTQNECARLEGILAHAGEIHKCVCMYACCVCVCMQASVTTQNACAQLERISANAGRYQSVCV
jgi:hypothetical protein